ncbi:hypothetical protein, partial [Ralstonia pseudosolanacearum]|uniref:hypothetical protein n=1 Tax=Ralstonia pseudosolanacearum TaxID=1310165 RepID=UPI003CFBC224
SILKLVSTSCPSMRPASAALAMPAPLASIPLHSVFDGQTLCGARLALGQTLGALPVALLHG